MSNSARVRRITYVALLGAIASALYAVPGIPIISSIYKLDFSTLPVMIGGFAIGPLSGLIILIIKDLTGLMHTSSMGVGELADFLASGTLMLISAVLYRRSDKSDWKASAAMIAGLFSMVLVAAAVNYWIMLPFYVNVMGFPMEAVIGMIAKVIPAVDTLPKLILYATVPFNLLKGTILCVLTLLLNRRLGKLINGKNGL